MSHTAAGAAGLPSFEDPPLTEVVWDLAFHQIPDLGASASGWWRDLLRDEYPQHEIHPALPPLIHPKVAAQMGVGIMLEPASGGTRTWNVSEDGQLVVQLQQDRLILNWRRLPEGDSYPRYERLAAEFERLVTKLNGLLKEKLGGAAIRPMRLEIVYQNMIEPEEGIWADFGDVGAVFPWLAIPSGIPAPNALQVHVESPMNTEGSGLRTLAFDVAPARNNQTGTGVLSLRVASTAWLAHDTLETALAAASEAHIEIVAFFGNATSPEMQSVWGKKEN